MTTASNLLAFLGLVITLLIVWRQSWPARLRLFAAQSLLLAALAGTVGVLAQRRGLVLVAAVVVFSVLRPDTFATAANWRSIAVSQSVLAVAAIKATNVSVEIPAIR